MMVGILESMAAPFAVLVFLTLIDSRSIFCMAAIATEAATSNPSSEFRNYELAEHRDEKGCRGPTVEWWTSLQPVVADVQLGSASRSRQLREDGDSNKIYEIGQMTGPILDDGLEMTMATLPARGKKEDNHHQQQVSVVKRSSQPLAKGRSRQLQDIDARGEAVSDQASWDRDSVGAVLKIDDLLSEGIRARCYQDSNGVNRCNPNFYFFGTSKCGTTSLAYWMAKHPALRYLLREGISDGIHESHVMDKPKLVYHEWAVMAPEATSTDVVMDYTPHYIAMAEVPFRIAMLHGKESFDSTLKYLVALREPVSRAVSSWIFKTHLENSRPFEDVVFEGMHRANRLMSCRRKAFKAEAKTKLGEVPQAQELSHEEQFNSIYHRDILRCNPGDYLERILYDSHIGKSLYALQLERWFKLFGRENFKVVFLDDMANDPVGTLEGVFSFLGMDLLDKKGEKGLPHLEDWHNITTFSLNTRKKRKQQLGDQVSPKLLANLRVFYASHNSDLEDLLGVQLPEAWTTLRNLRE